MQRAQMNVAHWRTQATSRPGALALALLGVVAVALAAWLIYDLAGTGGSTSEPAFAGPAPASFSVPRGLSNPGLEAKGIDSDGWSGKHVSFALAGGPAGNLVLRAEVPAQRSQHVDVSLNGRTVDSEDVKPGDLNLRIPVAASSTTRRIDVSWTHAIRLAAPDNREAAARLRYAGVVLPPAAIRVPADLTAPGVAETGVDADGWLKRRSTIMLSAGVAGKLVLQAIVPQGVDQRLSLRVNGKQLAAEKLSSGRVDLNVPLPASTTSRRIELRWSKLVALAPPDKRKAAALLEYVGLATPPAAVTIPAGLADPGLTASGIYSDGWVKQNASLTLASGRAGDLVIDADVPQQTSQALTVSVNGVRLASRPVVPGPLHLVLPVASSTAPRQISLHWAQAVKLAAPDNRRAAAQLVRLAVVQPPAAIDAPRDLTDPALGQSGIYADGWLKRHSALTLAGGPAGTLVVQAEIPEQASQTLTVTVNGQQIASRAVQPGTLDLALVVSASSVPRRIELAWSSMVRLAAPDNRDAAARLIHIGLAKPPASLSVPADLNDPGVAASGVYADGWMRQHAWLTLAGGKAGTLVLSASVPAQTGQTLTVVVNGTIVAARPVQPGNLQLTVPVPASTSSRRVELRWSNTIHLAAPDNRTAAAQLKLIAIR